MSVTTTHPSGDAWADEPTADEPTNASQATPAADGSRWSWVVAGVLLVLGVGLVLWANRGSTFYLDDWAFAVGRADLTADQLFGPQNQNWHLTTLLIYQALLHLWAFDTYVPYRLVSALVLLTIGLLTYVYARRRIGPWWSLGALVPVVITSGTEIVLWPFQIGQLLSIAGGLGALVLLDREGPRRIGAVIGAGLLLVMAVASSSAGIPMLLLVLADGVLRALKPTVAGLRKPGLITLAAGIPALLVYAWWHQVYGKLSPPPQGTNLPAFNGALSQTIDAGQAATQRLLGLFDTPSASGPFLGQIAFAALVVLVCARIFGPHRADRPRILAITAAVVGYWFLLSWGRSNVQDFTASPRYLFISQVLLVLLLVEIGASLRWQFQDRAGVFALDRVRTGWVALCGLGVAFAVWASFQTSQQIREDGYHLRVAGWATNGQNAAFDLLPDESKAMAPFYLDAAGRGLGYPGSLYLEGLQRFGGSPPSEADLKAMPSASRQFADAYLLAYYGPLVPDDQLPATPRGDAPELVAGDGEAPTIEPVRGKACAKVTHPTELGTVAIPTDRPLSITNTGPVDAWLQGRRYADAWSPRADIVIPPGQTRVLRIAPDGGTAPWHVQARGSSWRICTAPPTSPS